MKTLFKSDHAAWLFIASSALLIAAIILHRPEAAAMSVLSLYIAFDVLGYKHVMHGPRKITQCQEVGLGVVEMVSGQPGTAATAAYRLFQHGLFIVILALLWGVFDYRVALSPFIVWITFGADVAYHWISRDALPEWGNTTYYGYGYWSGPVGWYYWIFRPVATDAFEFGTWNEATPRIIPSTGLYVQAIIGACAAVAVWI